MTPATSQEKGRAPLDLTTAPSPDQEGLGVPGNTGGGTSGGPIERTTSVLPLRLNILKASAGDAGDLILDIQLQNLGPEPFDLPVSRNISNVQKTPGRLRREFLFAVRSLAERSKTLTVAVTAGSTMTPDSVLRLQPRDSVHVLLRVRVDHLRSVRSGTQGFGLEVVCGQWTLDDHEFLIRAIAQDLVSENTVLLDSGQAPRITNRQTPAQ